MTQTKKPWQLLVAAGLVWAETAALLVTAGLFLLPLSSGSAKDAGTLLALSGFVLLAAIWLATISSGLLKLKQSSRTPALLWQLFQIVIAGGSATGAGANLPFASMLLVPSVAVIVLLFSKPVSALLQRQL